MILNKILKMINSHEYITIIDVTIEANDRLITLAFIIRIEIFKIFNS